jgi:flagellar export protein FliJ
MPLADYADKVETEAARRVAACAKTLQTKEQEVAQLRSYLAEYRQRAEAEQKSADALRWRNTRAFLARLSDAVAQHEAELQKAEERYRLESERWRESQRRARSLDTVIERGEQEAMREAERRAQAELDELVMRRTFDR